MDIYITDHKEYILTTDHMLLQVHEAYAKGHHYEGQLSDAPLLGNSQEVRLFVPGWFAWKNVPVSALLQKALQNYFTYYFKKQWMWYDCYAFACEASGVVLHHKEFLHSFWESEVLKRTPQPGDVVFLGDSRNHFFQHAAICIHKELFISVYGAGGDIEFSTLGDMVRDLQPKDVLLCTPKP